MNKKKICILCVILSITTAITATSPVLATTTHSENQIMQCNNIGNNATTPSEDQELITKAENALNEAEKYLLKGYVDIAKSYINQLKEGTIKDSFMVRINKVEKSILDAEEAAKKAQIDEANIAVGKCEKTLKREDLQNAQKLVNSLPDSDIKTSLKNRLIIAEQNVIKAEDEAKKEALKQQKIHEATVAVEKAEDMLQEYALNYAINLVNKLEECAEKSALLKKIEKIKDAMQNAEVERVSRALESVKTAEKTSKREDYNNAQKLVYMLPKGDIRTNLEARLKVALENVKKAEQLEKENAAENEKIKKATEAVVKLETSLKPSDLNTATSLVDRLKDGDAKKALKDRIEKAKDKIKYATQAKIDEATNAVNVAETTLVQLLYDRAKDLVYKLDIGDARKALEQRLKVIQEKMKQSESDKENINKIQLKYCKEQIDIFEKTPSVEGINTIEALLKILKDNSEKTKQEERFTKLKDFFISKLENKAKYDIKIAKKLKNYDAINLAKRSVSLLPEGTLKTSLYTEISNIK